LHHRDVVDHRSVRVALEERNNLLSVNVPLHVRTTVGARKFTRPLDLCSPPSLVPTSDRRTTTTR
jgi:hypothetical protein